MLSTALCNCYSFLRKESISATVIEINACKIQLMKSQRIVEDYRRYKLYKKWSNMLGTESRVNRRTIWPIGTTTTSRMANTTQFCVIELGRGRDHPNNDFNRSGRHEYMRARIDQWNAKAVENLWKRDIWCSLAVVSFSHICRM